MTNEESRRFPLRKSVERGIESQTSSAGMPERIAIRLFCNPAISSDSRPPLVFCFVFLFFLFSIRSVCRSVRESGTPAILRVRECTKLFLPCRFWRNKWSSWLVLQRKGSDAIRVVSFSGVEGIFNRRANFLGTAEGPCRDSNASVGHDFTDLLKAAYSSQRGNRI